MCICVFFVLLLTGGKNDGGRCCNICCMLATFPNLFHRYVILSGADRQTLHPGCVSGNLLVGYEQFHVQPYYILLDEF